NWQRQRIQNPSSVSSSLTWGTLNTPVDTLMFKVNGGFLVPQAGNVRKVGRIAGFSVQDRQMIPRF
ncbi:MAG: hypothetical protein ACTHV5_08900, partial [Candidatus Corynebacterium faecigallinarum]